MDILDVYTKRGERVRGARNATVSELRQQQEIRAQSVDTHHITRQHTVHRSAIDQDTAYLDGAVAIFEAERRTG